MISQIQNQMCWNRFIKLSGHDVVVIDDFSNSKPDVLESIYKITGKHVKFYEFNVLDEEKTESVFKENKLDAVIHCCAFKAVGESVQKPIEYYSLLRI